MGLVLILALVVGLTLLPIATFLILFTSFGDVVRRWMRHRPARKQVRFDLRALLVLMGAVGASVVLMKGLSPHTGEFGPYANDVLGDETRPQITLFNLWFAWLVTSPAVSGGMAAARFLIDSWDERKEDRKRRPSARSSLPYRPWRSAGTGGSRSSREISLRHPDR